MRCDWITIIFSKNFEKLTVYVRDSKTKHIYFPNTTHEIRIKPDPGLAHQGTFGEEMSEVRVRF
jgi:hypothetical protein